MIKRLSFILLLCNIFFCEAQKGVIKGKIYTDTPIDFSKEKTQLLLQIGNKEKTFRLDKSLSFAFNNLKADSVKLYIETKTTKKNLLISGFLQVNDTVAFDLTYDFYCRYNKSKNNKTCPICKKQDQVIPIYYGYISEPPKGVEFKIGGCRVTDCNPNWFCKRNSLSF